MDQDDDRGGPALRAAFLPPPEPGLARRDPADAGPLAVAPAGPWDRRAALAIALLSLVVLAVVVPIVGEQWVAMPAFIPAYQSAAAVNDLVTAALLFGQYREARRPSLLLLGGGYLFTAALVVAHALSFPGAFAPSGGFIGGPQTTVWLWLAWHVALPSVVLAYALGVDRGHDEGRGLVPGRSPLLVAVVVPLALAGVAVLVATVGDDRLPVLLQGNRYVPGVTRPALAFALSLLALAVLVLRTRLRRALDLWLAVVMGAWAVEILLSAVLNSGRFQAGFTSGASTVSSPPAPSSSPCSSPLPRRTAGSPAPRFGNATTRSRRCGRARRGYRRQSGRRRSASSSPMCRRGG